MVQCKISPEKRLHSLNVHKAIRFYIFKTEGFYRMSQFICFHNKKRLRATEVSISKWLRWCIIESYKAKGLPGPRVFNSHFEGTTWAEYRTASVLETWEAAICYLEFLHHEQYEHCKEKPWLEHRHPELEGCCQSSGWLCFFAPEPFYCLNKCWSSPSHKTVGWI